MTTTRGLTTEEAALICGAHSRSVLRWVKAGRIRGYQTGGGRWRIRPDDLRAFMRDRGMRVPSLLDPGPRRVVIVDDEPHHARALAEVVDVLVPGPLEVRVAYDGFTGGLLVASFRPHVLFLDVRMPGVDGFAVCREIRSNPDLDSVAIVIVSGALDDDTRDRLRALGVNRCIDKPVDPELVGRALDDFLVSSKETPPCPKPLQRSRVASRAARSTPSCPPCSSEQSTI